MSVDWIRMGKEMANMPGGVTVLRALQAHGIHRLIETTNTNEIGASCTIDMVIDYAHKEKSLGGQ